MTSSNHVFTAFSFLGFLMCAVPLPWHLEAWNTGTCLYMVWTGLSCLNQFINSIVWDGNAINWAPVWCDISSRLIIGTAVAIPAASLCINRRLYHIASVKSVLTISPAEKRRGVMVDLAIGLGLPVLEMVLQYIVQGHRFNIFEDVGCWPFTYDTWLAYILVSLPPILIGLVSMVYAIMSIRAFQKTRALSKEFLSMHANLTSGRYLRLMCLAGIEVICTVPLGAYAIYLNAADHGIRPWKGWADTHSHFSRVDQIPALLWRSNHITEVSLELSRWLCVICAIVFFAFFGFAEEARKNYRSAIQTVTQKVGLTISSGSFATSSGSGGVLSSNGAKSKTGSRKVKPVVPVLVHKEFLRRQDSLDSFSNMSLSIADVGGFLDEKKVNEKSEQPFSPTLSYGGITLSDVGGTLADYSEGPYSPTPSSGSSSASSDSIASPEPALTRSNSDVDIEISSLRHDSTIIESPQKSHTHDMV